MSAIVSRSLLAVLCATVVPVGAVAAEAAVAQASAVETYELKINSQPLAEALKAFAQQSGLQVMFFAEVTSGLQAPSVTGRLTRDEALQQLLKDSGLTYRALNATTVAVSATGASRSSMAQLQDASVRLAQEATSSAGAESQRASGISGQSGVENSPSLQLDEVIVTGTHIRGQTPVGANLVVIDREDIEASGYGNLGQVIQSLPQNFGGGASQTLNKSIRGFAGLNTSIGTGVNLRGLGNGATLTLLNGQRMAPAGQGTFVDISLIPLGAIDHIEVLTDGASAIYGADAIGGVVNIITRKDFSGAQTRARYGSVTEGDRQEYSFGQLFGHSWDSGNLTLNYDHTHDDKLSSADRSFSQSLPQPTDLLVQQTADSGFASLSQAVAPRVDLSASLFMGRREFEQANSPSATVTRFSSGDTVGSLASAGLTIAHGETWHTDLVAVHASNTLNRRDRIPASSSDRRLRDETRTRSFEARSGGNLFELPAGSVKLAMGVSYRQDSDAANISVTYDLDREISSAHAEFLIPLFGDDATMPGFESLSLSIAGRYDRYSDVGSTKNPKIGLEWVPVRGLTARAAYSTSFRAPLFFEQAFPLSGLLFDLPDPLSVRPDGLTTTILLNGGNPGLEPEKGRSWTAGLELQPPAIPKLRARLNYFDVEYRGQIQELINRFSIDALQNGAALAQFITRNPDDPAVTALVNSIPDGVLDLVNTFAFITDPATLLAQNTIGAIYAGQYQNAGVTTVRGLDFDIQYSQALGNGTLNLGLNGTNLLEYDLAATAGSPGVDLLNIAFNPVDLRFRASATWTQGAWAASTFVNYVDAYRDRGSAFTTGGAIPSWTTVDFQIRYGSSNSSGWLGDGAIALSFTNLFNIDPPKLNALPLQLPFDAENANPLGRLISLTVTKNW